MKAVANSTGRSMDKIKSDYRDTGDLGLVAKVVDDLNILVLQHKSKAKFISALE